MRSMLWQLGAVWREPPKRKAENKHPRGIFTTSILNANLIRIFA